MNKFNKIQKLLYQLGSYLCIHFRINIIPSKKRSCCGGDSNEYIPTCRLINGICVGLPQCPRLDIKTKGDLIKQWKQDLKNNKPVNPTDYIKK